MSHFYTLRTKLMDGEILKASLRDLGIRVATNGTVRGVNDQRQAEIVAVLEGDYDIDWSCNAAGSFDLIADLWGVAKNHNQAELINAINQKYSVKSTSVQVKQPGLQNATVKVVVHQ